MARVACVVEFPPAIAVSLIFIGLPLPPASAHRIDSSPSWTLVTVQVKRSADAESGQRQH